MNKYKHLQYHAGCFQNLLLELSVAFDEDGERCWPCPSTCQVGRVFQGCPCTRHCGRSVCLLLWAAAVLGGLQLGPGQGGTATVQGAPCGSLLALPCQVRAGQPEIMELRSNIWFWPRCQKNKRRGKESLISCAGHFFPPFVSHTFS